MKRLVKSISQLNDKDFALLHLYYLSHDFTDCFQAFASFINSDYYHRNNRNYRFYSVQLTHFIKNKK